MVSVLSSGSSTITETEDGEAKKEGPNSAAALLEAAMAVNTKETEVLRKQVAEMKRSHLAMEKDLLKQKSEMLKNSTRKVTEQVAMVAKKKAPTQNSQKRISKRQPDKKVMNVSVRLFFIFSLPSVLKVCVPCKICSYRTMTLEDHPGAVEQAAKLAIFRIHLQRRPRRYVHCSGSLFSLLILQTNKLISTWSGSLKSWYVGKRCKKS